MGFLIRDQKSSLKEPPQVSAPYSYALRGEANPSASSFPGVLDVWGKKHVEACAIFNWSLEISRRSATYPNAARD
jgi:hypothetical protein